MVRPLSFTEEVVSSSPHFILFLFFVTEFSESYLGKTPILLEKHANISFSLQHQVK